MAECDDFFFQASCSNHCLTALDLEAGVQQPFDCLIVQNRQAVQSMRRSAGWTLEDDMVDGLFFCATLTGRRGGHTIFAQTGAETPDARAEAVKPDPGSSWEGRSGDGCDDVIRRPPFQPCLGPPNPKSTTGCEKWFMQNTNILVAGYCSCFP